MAHPNWKEVRKGDECPACGKGDWCTRTVDRLMVLCHRVPSDRPAAGGDAWYHPQGDDRDVRRGPVREVDCWGDVLAAAAAMTNGRRAALEQKLSLPHGASLMMDHVGYGCDRHGRHEVFPMWDARGLCGYSRRYEDQKLSWGSNGVFLPNADPGGPVYVVEGATDVLAAAAMGLFAVGRPSNSGGAAAVAELLAPTNRPVIVVAENDEKASGLWPGMSGAFSVRDQVGARLKDRRVVVRPVPGGVKDTREWAVKNGFDGRLFARLIGHH